LDSVDIVIFHRRQSGSARVPRPEVSSCGWLSNFLYF
jgi:hypothetical protein